MDFRILGPLEVHNALGAIDVPGTKPRAVLAVLLLHANQPVSPERIAHALWGEDAPAGAVRTVQVHISRLRKALGDGEALTTTPAGYRLRVQPGELDAERFERLVENGRRALSSGQAEQAGTTLREALSLWRGEPLADLAFEPFAQVEIARLEEQHQAAIEARVDADLAAGRHEELVAELRRMVAEYPSRERLAGQLMTALYRGGRQSEALEAYREARERLATEVGVEPGDELRALQEAILHHDAALMLAAAQELPHELDAAASPPLIGREDELAWLRDRWEETCAGNGRLIALAGAPGMGKTRLAAELGVEVHAGGGTVLYASGAGPARAVHEVLGRSRSARPPVLLVVDEADQASGDVLAAVRQASGGSTLVLATARDHEALDGLDPGVVLFLDLERLGPAAVAEIAALYVPGQTSEPLPAEWLLGASAGVPQRVHDVASQWAKERVSTVADQAAAGRSQLRSMEDELAGGVVHLQTVREWREAPGNGDERVVCPFKGLASFEADDAPYFFGREQLVAELVARLVGAPLLAVVGPSGSGKSSVVKAGLLPALKSGVLPGSERWPQFVIRPGEHPLRQLDRALASAPADRFVLAVDQFEETFTVCRDEAERASFISQLVRESAGVVVIALRADFYGRCAEYPELSRLLASNHTLVGPMQAEELRRAVVCPAQRVGLSVDEELVDQIVDDVEDAPGALPLLSTALLELWQHREGRRLRVATYERTGGVHGAVARLAEAAYNQLDEEQRELARRVLLQLVEVDDQGGVERRRLPLTDLGAKAEPLLDVLADARLVTVCEGTVELAHEALLREWPQLRSWIEDSRDDLRTERRLRAAAQEWVRRDKDEDELHRGARLAEAREWRLRANPVLHDLEREFLDASEARSRAQRAARRRRIEVVIGLLAAALVVITGVAIVAVQRGQEAERQRDIAFSRELAAKATSVLDADPGLSVGLALEALRRGDTAEAVNVLRQATAAARGLTVRQAHDGWVYGLGHNADRKRLVTAGADGKARVWDADGAPRGAAFRAGAGAVSDAAISPDGRLVATTTEDGIVATFDSRGRSRRVLLRTAPVTAARLAFSPDGRQLAAAMSDGTIRVITLAGGESVTLPGKILMLEASFNRSATKVAAAGLDGARLWDLASRTSIRLPHPGGASSVAFSPDGRRLATAADDGVVRVWDAVSAKQISSFQADTQALFSVRYSPDGRRLVTAGEDETVRVWDVRGGPALSEMKGHRGRVLRAEFGPRGRTVASVGEDGTLRIWQPADTANLRGPVRGVSIGPDDSHVISGGSDGSVRAWDLRTGRSRALSQQSAPTLVQASADGAHIASASEDGTVRVIDVESGRSEQVAREAYRMFAAALDSTGRRIAFGGQGASIFLQERDGTARTELKGHKGAVYDLAFSPDDARLASAAEDGTIRIWRTKDGTLERILRGHDEAVSSVTFSGDGEHVASGGVDGTLRVWRVADGRSVTLYGHRGAVESVAYSPRGDRLVSAGRDGTVRVWASTGGETLVVLHTHRGTVTGAVFSRDGEHVFSAGEDGNMRVSECDVCGSDASVLRLARERAGRELTAAERQRFLPQER